MRSKDQPASLGEIMGSSAQKPKMSLADLGDIIGHDKVVDLPQNRVGRHRLRKALQQRFGSGYRNIPGVKDLLDEFDDNTEFAEYIEKIRAVQPKRKE